MESHNFRSELQREGIGDFELENAHILTSFLEQVDEDVFGSGQNITIALAISPDWKRGLTVSYRLKDDEEDEAYLIHIRNLNSDMMTRMDVIEYTGDTGTTTFVLPRELFFMTIAIHEVRHRVQNELKGLIPLFKTDIDCEDDPMLIYAVTRAKKAIEEYAPHLRAIEFDAYVVQYLAYWDIVCRKMKGLENENFDPRIFCLTKPDGEMFDTGPLMLGLA